MLSLPGFFFFYFIVVFFPVCVCVCEVSSMHYILFGLYRLSFACVSLLFLFISTREKKNCTEIFLNDTRWCKTTFFVSELLFWVELMRMCMCVILNLMPEWKIISFIHFFPIQMGNVFFLFLMLYPKPVYYSLHFICSECLFELNIFET